jgi:hypothetical protein
MHQQKSYNFRRILIFSLKIEFNTESIKNLKHFK